MPVPLCQVPSPVFTGVVTTVSSSTLCLATYSAVAAVISAAPFVPSLEVTPVEPMRKRHCEESSEDCQEILAAFEELWATREHSSLFMSLA